MDGIITILIIAAAVIFKIVGKKLNSSVGDEVFPPIPLEEADVEVKAPVVKVPVAKSPTVKVKKVREVEESVKTKKTEVSPILEEEQPVKKEKIDPKKLIVYSEIMKPKYLE